MAEHVKPEIIFEGGGPTPCLVYRAALVALIAQGGGELFVACDTVEVEGGVILFRLERDGIRFRFERAARLQ